jgi:hypothetical protein
VPSRLTKPHGPRSSEERDLLHYLTSGSWGQFRASVLAVSLGPILPMRVARPRVLAAVFIGLLLGLFPARAQISPGPLSRPHQSLNGATNCASCHKLGAGAANFKCLDCHTEIAARLAAHKGLHASYRIAAGSSQECARCHSEHNGEDFPLIKWDLNIFDSNLDANSRPTVGF